VELYRIEVKDPKPKCFYLVVNGRHEVERWLKRHLLRDPQVERIAADHGPGTLLVDCRSGPDASRQEMQRLTDKNAERAERVKSLCPLRVACA
jgi:hypothetical protein